MNYFLKETNQFFENHSVHSGINPSSPQKHHPFSCQVPPFPPGFSPPGSKKLNILCNKIVFFPRIQK